MAQTKRCSKCREFKPLSDFHRDRGQLSGLSCRCRRCRGVQRRRRYIESGEHERMAQQYEAETRSIRYQRRYGITLADYDEMLEEQGGGCAICGKTPEDNGKRLGVDHDHNTGRVRGLLCDKCNSGLGMLRDDSTLLLRAVEYLEVEEE